MPLLRPSNSDFLAFVKAAATSPAGGAVRSAASVGAPLVIGRGAAVRASYAGTKSSPASSVVQLFGPVTSGPPPFVDVWLGKLAVVTTLAGGTGGTADGTGGSAQFSAPTGVAVFPNGNVVVVDTSSHRIRLVTPAGVVTTLAGSGNSFAEGTGSAAAFSLPFGVAVLPNGNIVVADRDNHRIRLVTLAGVVTTLAGSTAGFLDGTGAAAQFNNPQGVAVFPNGNIVVADTSNHRIRLVTPAGVVTTLAGNNSGGNFVDGTGAVAGFNRPYGVAVLPNGNIVVADVNNGRIRLVTPEGVVTTLAGASAGGGFLDATGTAAQFNNPSGVAVLPNGNIVVTDGVNNRIRLITMPSGVVTTLAGSGSTFADGTGTAAGFTFPRGIAVLPSGVIVVGDTDNSRIRLITPT
jgi:glucose/arabinose dehydrogenase